MADEKTPEITDHIKVVCEADERNWLTFDRAKMTRKNRDRYYEIVSPVERTKPGTDDDGEPKEILKTAAEIEAEIEQREINLYLLLQLVLVDGQLIVDGEVVSGVEAIFAADLEEITLDVEAFLGSAFPYAVQQLASLGNSKRLA